MSPAQKKEDLKCPNQCPLPRDHQHLLPEELLLPVDTLHLGDHPGHHPSLEATPLDTDLNQETSLILGRDLNLMIDTEDPADLQADLPREVLIPGLDPNLLHTIQKSMTLWIKCLS